LTSSSSSPCLGRRARQTAALHPRAPSRVAWIRSQPASTPAKDLVEQAKAEGIQLSLAQVYTARSTANKGPARNAGAALEGTLRIRGRREAAGPTSDSEASFRRLVVAIGVDKAERYLRALKQDLDL